MNYLTNMKNVTKLSERELLNTSKSSWHDQYKDSAWIYVGGLPFDLSEGDIICIFSQYGEVVNINLIRAKETGKSKGFCFLCYEDQRSTILAVDNLNGIKILNRTIRVDHVQDYKMPKEDKKATVETKQLHAEGCAPKAQPPVVKKEPVSKEYVRETLADQIEGEIKLPARLPIYTNTIKTEKTSDNEAEIPVAKETKDKPKKKKKKSRNSGDDSDPDDFRREKVKKKKKDKREKNKQDEPVKDEKHSSKFISRERSRSRDRGQIIATNYRRGVSPSIPKRWR